MKSSAKEFAEDLRSPDKNPAGPIILAVDTSSPIAGFALSSGDRVIASLTVNTLRPHSQNLFPTLTALCRLTGISLTEIEAFAVVTGPGSFTGLRVGLAAIKGLADSLGKPALGTTTFDLLALSSGRAGSHLITINAGRGEVYCGVREVVESWKVQSRGEDCVCKNAALKDFFSGSFSPVNTTLVLEGEYGDEQINELQSHWNIIPAQMIRAKRERLHLAGYLAVLGSKMLNSGVLEPLVPYYIRPSEAEIKKRLKDDKQSYV